MVMVDTEDMVDTADTMAASADLLKLKLPQLHTMVVMVDTEDMVDTVDTMVASADLLNHLHTMDMVDMEGMVAMEVTDMAANADPLSHTMVMEDTEDMADMDMVANADVLKL